MPSILAQSVTFGSGRFLEFFYIAIQNLVDQARFSRAGHTGDADEHAQRNLDVDIFQIVGARAFDLDHALRQRLTVARRQRNRLALAQIRRRQRLVVFEQLLIGTRRT